jgi:hypothetical protein
MDRRHDGYKICSVCGKRRPLNLFWDPEKYEEESEICTICAIGDYN